MSKTAVIITGQARTFRYTFKTLDWCLFRKLKNPHFFISVADDREAPDMDLIRANYHHVESEFVNQPEKIDEPEGNVDAHAGWFRSASVQGILKQFWALEQGYKFFLSKIHDALSDFPVIVRVRPDIWCQDIAMPEIAAPRDCWTPWWGTFGGVNDRLAIMGPQAAKGYFTVFDQRHALWNAGCPLHPETMVKAALEFSGANIIPKLQAEFRICRLPDVEHKVPWLVNETFQPHELAAMILGNETSSVSQKQRL